MNQRKKTIQKIKKNLDENSVEDTLGEIFWIDTNIN